MESRAPQPRTAQNRDLDGRTRTDHARATIEVRRKTDKAFELQLCQGFGAAQTMRGDHRLDGISFMVALLAHSSGAGFSNLVEASKVLLAGRRRHPEVLLYGRRR